MDEGIHAYKVVTSDRKSLLPSFLFRFGGRFSEKTHLEEKLTSSGLVNTYRKGNIFTAKNWAQPLCCFKSHRAATHWAGCYFHSFEYKTIEIKGYHEVPKDSVRLLHFNHDRWQKYLTDKYVPRTFPNLEITGAVFFRKIEVLT